MMPVAGPSHFTFASKSNVNLNRVRKRFTTTLPVSVATSMLAEGVPVANRAVGAHSRNLNTSGRCVSLKASRATALVGAFGVDAVRVCTAPSDSLATLINVVAALTLECVIGRRCHVEALRVIAVITGRTSVAPEARRQVLAANFLVARLEQVAL